MTKWGDLQDESLVGLSFDFGNPNASDIIKRLFVSAGHRSNLLNKDFQQIGISTCNDSGKFMKTVLFFADDFKLNKVGRKEIVNI